MKNIFYTLICLTVVLSVCAVRAGKKVVSSNGTLQRGTSVVCPDNTSQWACSIGTSLHRNAPPPDGVPVLAGKNAQGRLTITINKTDIPADVNASWFQSNKFYTPQAIEIERSFYLDVMGEDATKYIEPGFYPIIETGTTFQIII